jgi:2-polyprenyl-6-methoxyphenol hydroxylase-like FAD-dependent oxidoreductase
MSNIDFHVIIIGGGIGGLCLAQGLKKAGISVAVYERDRTRSERLQGYRIHLTPQGNRALYECLPPYLYETLIATTGKSAQGMSFHNERLEELFFTDPYKDQAPDLIEKNRWTSRITLRQVLLAGLDKEVHFDKIFTHYEEQLDGRIKAFFEDGTSVAGNLLVGADGVNSRVRKQFLPQAERIETGVVDILGKIPLTDETRALLAFRRPDSMGSGVLTRQGYGMFIFSQELDHRPDEHDAIGGNDENIKLHPGLLFDNTLDYIFWAFVSREHLFQIPPRDMNPSELQRVVLERIQDWHPLLQQLVRETDLSTVMTTRLRTSVPIDHWETQRITLLGDAIHSMPPTQGVGGNIALCDARLLQQMLIAAQRGEYSLLQAVHDYEVKMLDYGFEAVSASMRALQMAVGIDSSVGGYSWQEEAAATWAWNSKA